MLEEKYERQRTESPKIRRTRIPSVLNLDSSQYSVVFAFSSTLYLNIAEEYANPTHVLSPDVPPPLSPLTRFTVSPPRTQTIRITTISKLLRFTYTIENRRLAGSSPALYRNRTAYEKQTTFWNNLHIKQGGFYIVNKSVCYYLQIFGCKLTRFPFKYVNLRGCLQSEFSGQSFLYSSVSS